MLLTITAFSWSGLRLIFTRTNAVFVTVKSVGCPEICLGDTGTHNKTPNKKLSGTWPFPILIHTSIGARGPLWSATQSRSFKATSVRLSGGCGRPSLQKHRNLTRGHAERILRQPSLTCCERVFPSDLWSNSSSASGPGPPTGCPLGLGLVTSSWPWADAAGLRFGPVWYSGLPAHQLWALTGSFCLGQPVLNRMFMIPNSRAHSFHQLSGFGLLASSWALLKIPIPILTPGLQNQKSRAALPSH